MFVRFGIFLDFNLMAGDILCGSCEIQTPVNRLLFFKPPFSSWLFGENQLVPILKGFGTGPPTAAWCLLTTIDCSHRQETVD